MWKYILAFDAKLRLCECQLDKEIYVLFPTLEESKLTSNTGLITVIRNLRTEFSSRFSDIRSLQNLFRLFSTPFNEDVYIILEKFRMGLIESQCSDELEPKFHTEGNQGISPLGFYKKCLFKRDLYPSFSNNAKKGMDVW